MELKDLFKKKEECIHEYENVYVETEIKVYGNLFSALFTIAAIQRKYKGNVQCCKKCGHTIEPKLYFIG